MGCMTKCTYVRGLDGRSQWRETHPCYDGVDDNISLSQGVGQSDVNPSYDSLDDNVSSCRGVVHATSKEQPHPR